MIAIALLAILFGRHINSVHRQREAVQELRRMGVQVRYDAPPDDDEEAEATGRPRPPAWLVRWLGEDHFRKVISIDAMAPDPAPGSGAIDTERFRRCLGSLPDIRSMFISEEFLDDEAFEGIGGLKNLEDLSMRELGKATDEGVSRLRDLPKLRSLHFPGEGLTEGMCRALAEIPNLERLSLERGFGDREVAWLSRSRSIKDLYLLSDTLTDRAFEAAGEMPQLEVFLCFGLHASDGGLKALNNCPNLKSLTIDWASQGVTKEGIAALGANASLTTLSINWGLASDEEMSRRDEAAAALRSLLPGLSKVSLSRNEKDTSSGGGIAPP